MFCDGKPKMSGRVKDLTGRQCGRLTVIEYAGNDSQGHARWLCECNCPDRTRLVVPSRRLVGGDTKSCGCLRSDRAKTLRLTHGLYIGIDQSTKEGRTLRAAIQRCYDPEHPKYYLYGGRGIKVCDRWRGPEKQRNFLADLGLCPGPDWSIDRIDPEGDYTPENCRWLLKSENSGRIRRDVRFKPHPLDAVLPLVCFGATQEVEGGL